MNEFYYENMKYHVIASDDRKHFILVGHTPEEIKAFAEAHKLNVTDTKENYYGVRQSDTPTNFSVAVSVFVRKLDPFGEYGSMFPYFYYTPTYALVTRGVYVGDGGCPFHVIKNVDKLTQLKVPHA